MPERLSKESKSIKLASMISDNHHKLISESIFEVLSEEEIDNWILVKNITNRYNIKEREKDLLFEIEKRMNS